MSSNSPSTLAVRSVPLTPKSDKNGVRVKLKVFWKTTKFWTEADIIDFQRSVSAIAERLRSEQYWNKYGEINRDKFTCEDFAVRVLCEYASSKELPVKLTTGVRTYRNMEMYTPSAHDRYASNMNGFSEMVMLSFGAPDMQRIGINTTVVTTPEELRSGDILAQSRDNLESRAHHIQLVYSTSKDKLNIYQGNSGVGNWASKMYKVFGHNPADPKDSSYTGQAVEIANYSKENGIWNYKNVTTGRDVKDFLKYFQFYRWNFKEFNR